MVLELFHKIGLIKRIRIIIWEILTWLYSNSNKELIAQVTKEVHHNKVFSNYIIKHNHHGLQNVQQQARLNKVC